VLGEDQVLGSARRNPLHAASSTPGAA
jgi:hypothetical protein